MKRYSLALIVALGLVGPSTAHANPFEKVCIERGESKVCGYFKK